jgi:hypothetical protein
MTYQDLQALTTATDQALGSLGSFGHRSPLHQRAARGLRAASRLLDTLALRLTGEPTVQAHTQPVLEYHADAGAPEGALYVNGQLVGHVMGVTRL